MTIEKLNQKLATLRRKSWFRFNSTHYRLNQFAECLLDCKAIDKNGEDVLSILLGSLGRYRIEIVDEQIREMAKNMSPDEIKNTYLKVKLTQ